jgi:competence protein ComEC
MLRMHFCEVKQALAALVDLLDGRHILVDTADYSLRLGCGQPCADASAHLMSKLTTNLAGAPIDLTWITHQHSDHIGGATDVMRSLPVANYVDNGRDVTIAEIMIARSEATTKSIPLTVVSPSGATIGDCHGAEPNFTPSICGAPGLPLKSHLLREHLASLSHA